MLPEVLAELLRLYARRGIADWAKARDEERRRATDCLGTKIAENETEANVAISTIYNGNNENRLRFIPMPKYPGSQGFERSFFVPVCTTKPDGTLRIGLELFLLVTGKNCLAFRFEQAHERGKSTHDFAHVQMSRKLLGERIESKVQAWIPNRYPAFPISPDPLRMFLSMATSIHGHTGGMLTILQEIFQSAGKTAHVGKYFAEIRSILN